jgi:hypothetical protein
MRSAALFLTLLAAPFVGTLVAHAQSPPVEPGTRVRVSAPDLGIRNHVGALQVLNADSIVMEDGLMFPMASITQLDVSRGRKSWALLGAGVGLVVGAGLGGAIGAATGDEGGIAVGGGLVGFGLGTAIGAGIRSDRWDEVPLDRIRVSLVQPDGRFGFGASVRFLR